MVKALLFDWDGTIADTAEACYRCYVRMFGDFGIAFDRDAYQRTYSPDWYYTFECVGLPRERWCERLGIEPHEAAHVGDSPEDVLMAKTARVYAVAVPGGYPNHEALRAAGPDLHAEDLGSAVGTLLHHD